MITPLLPSQGILGAKTSQSFHQLDLIGYLVWGRISRVIGDWEICR